MINYIIKIFCQVDDFCINFNNYFKSFILDNSKNKKFKLWKSPNLALSEVMTIIIFFHLSCYRNFKTYYKNYVCENLRNLFPGLVSYNRFVELMSDTLIPMIYYTNSFSKGKCTGISFIDSTPIKVCNNRRIKNHKVFKGFAERGKSSMGWFYGFKLHLVVNDKGEIVSFCLTTGNVDDRNESVIELLSKDLFGKLFGDRGYISKKLFELLYNNGIQLFTKIRSNMKNKLIPIEDKLLLRKRAIIETINDFLKNICYIEHTRHRSILNFLVNIAAGISAYSFIPKKPSLNIQRNYFLA